MLDNQLIRILRETIIAQEAIANIPGTPIKQAFQPTQQGVNSGPTAYFHILGYKRVGWPYRGDVYDPDAQKMIHTELQQYETNFQLSTLATQNPKDTDRYTAGDLANLIAYILQSERTVAAFSGYGIGILRIGEVRNPYFKDDRARNEASPSLDFTITNKQIVVSESGVLQSSELVIARV